MVFLDQVADDVMIAAFVKAEFDSARFQAAYRQETGHLNVAQGDLIDQPDTANREANDRRRRLLRAVRGYNAGRYLFQGWPTDVQWWRARVALDELARFKYAQYQTWVDLSKGSRLVRDGAANVDTVLVGENANANIKAVAAAVRAGRRFPELLLVAETLQGHFVLVEGHVRATAYVIARAPDPVDVLVGVSPNIKSWFYWESG